MEAPLGPAADGSEQHLLVVTTNFLQSTGGVQAHLRALLPRLVERGITTTAIFLGDPQPPFLWQGVRVLVLKRHLDLAEVLGVPHPYEWNRIVSLVTRDQLLGGPPVTHIATHTRFFPMSWLGVRLGHKVGVPVLHTEHGGGSVVTASPVLREGSRLVDHTMGKSVLKGADRVIAVSRRTARFVRDLAGVESVVVSNGVELSAWRQQAETRQASGPRPLVFIGRLVAEKGWRDFLDVVAQTRAAGWDGVAHIFGDGPERAQAHAEASRRQVPNVVFHGHASADEIRPVLSGAVYVNPSLASEGFQLTLVEAVAAGAAVASYAVGVAEELADLPWTDVAVVPQGNAEGLTRSVLELLGHPDPAPVQPEWLDRWNWDQVADRYRELLRTTRPGPRR